VIKERIQEILDFTRSESPYRKANKGWINPDIFLELKASSSALEQKKEAAKLTLLWSPINSIISKIFLIFIIGSLLVFISISLVNGRFDFDIFNNSLSNETLKVEVDKYSNTSDSSDSDDIKVEIQTDNNNASIDKSNIKQLSNELTVNDEQKLLNTKVDKQENKNQNIESSKYPRILPKKKSKSNFL